MSTSKSASSKLNDEMLRKILDSRPGLSSVHCFRVRCVERDLAFKPDLDITLPVVLDVTSVMLLEAIDRLMLERDAALEMAARSRF